MATFAGFRVNDRSGKLAKEKARMPKVGLGAIRLRNDVAVRDGRAAAKLLVARAGARNAKATQEG